ncbi:MAG: hypothetical protein E7342_04095 [Clostridiales bacterium]|nr:hypothetical protein [Clostridiales bacterium]
MKKITNEEIGEIIGKMAQEVRSKMNYEFNVARSQMWIVENDLVKTFSAEQKKLYDDFVEKRNDFYSIASEIYEKKY